MFGCGYDIKPITVSRENWEGWDVGVGMGMCQALGVKQGPRLAGPQRNMCIRPGFAFGSSESFLAEQEGLAKPGKPSLLCRSDFILVCVSFLKVALSPQGPTVEL